MANGGETAPMNRQKKFNFGWWLLRFMAVIGAVWDVVMIPAWVSQGQWGASLVQLLVLVALPSVITCFIYGSYCLGKRLIYGTSVQYPQERR